MSEHTPTPWHWQKEITIEPLAEPCNRRTVRYEIYTKSGPYGHPATCECEEDAEFIVRAANAHDDLLAACKAFVNAKDMEMVDGVAWEAALAAIAKAEPGAWPELDRLRAKAREGGAR